MKRRWATATEPCLHTHSTLEAAIDTIGRARLVRQNLHRGPGGAPAFALKGGGARLEPPAAFNGGNGFGCRSLSHLRHGKLRSAPSGAKRRAGKAKLHCQSECMCCTGNAHVLRVTVGLCGTLLSRVQLAETLICARWLSCFVYTKYIKPMLELCHSRANKTRPGLP